MQFYSWEKWKTKTNEKVVWQNRWRRAKNLFKKSQKIIFDRLMACPFRTLLFTWKPFWSTSPIEHVARAHVRKHPTFNKYKTLDWWIGMYECTYQIWVRSAQSLPSYSKVTKRTLGCARGTWHVRVHTTSDSCKTLSCQASRCIPNSGTMGPVVAEL